MHQSLLLSRASSFLTLLPVLLDITAAASIPPPSGTLEAFNDTLPLQFPGLDPIIPFNGTNPSLVHESMRNWPTNAIGGGPDSPYHALFHLDFSHTYPISSPQDRISRPPLTTHEVHALDQLFSNVYSHIQTDYSPGSTIPVPIGRNVPAHHVGGSGPERAQVVRGAWVAVQKQGGKLTPLWTRELLLGVLQTLGDVMHDFNGRPWKVRIGHVEVRISEAKEYVGRVSWGFA